MTFLLVQNARSQADIIIGAHGMYPPDFQSTHSYGVDSLTPCIRYAGIRPTWQNVFAICKSINIVYIGFVAYYATVIVLYLQAPFEHWKRIDSYTTMLKTLQYVVNTSPKITVKLTSTKLFMTFISWGFILFFNTVISFYYVTIHKSIPLHQIHTKQELIDNNFQFAGDVHALRLLKNDATVS